MSYLSCLLLHRLGQPPITFQTITEHFHRDFPSSRTRTPLALKRRMCSRYKKREGVASHLEICVEECLQDIVSWVTIVMGYHSDGSNGSSCVRLFLRVTWGQRHHLTPSDLFFSSSSTNISELLYLIKGGKYIYVQKNPS